MSCSSLKHLARQVEATTLALPLNVPPPRAQFLNQHDGFLEKDRQLCKTLNPKQ